MKYTQLAIDKAREGGYDPVKNPHTQSKIEDFIFLDQTFWKSLGKSLGLKEGVFIGGVQQVKGSGWWCTWHDFVDHLASGKTAESFFEDLLNN